MPTSSFTYLTGTWRPNVGSCMQDIYTFISSITGTSETNYQVVPNGRGFHGTCIIKQTT